MSKARPTIAISLNKTPLGWVVSTLTIQDGKIVKEERSEPDLRAIALETLQREMYVNFWKE
jgi:hypothetical protein